MSAAAYGSRLKAGTTISQPPVGPEDQAASSRLISVSNANRNCARIFKRGIVGSFHKVSRKYMPLYVAEF